MEEKKKRQSVTNKKATKKIIKLDASKKIKTESNNKSKTKKPAPKIVKKTKIVNNKSKTKEEKNVDEKWYVWLKNNIIENEAKYNRENRYRRLFTSLFAIFCFIVVFFTTSLLDYSRAIANNSEPLFVIRTYDEHKQVTIYYGTFYKAWKCDHEDTEIKYGRYNTDISFCTIVAKFDKNNEYINPNGVIITKEQMSIIKPYFFDEFINFETKEDLDAAYKLSSEIGKLAWVKPEGNKLEGTTEGVSLAIFKGLEKIDGINVWKLQYNNREYYKCYKQENNRFIFSNYSSNTNTCYGEWKPLKLDESTCRLSQTSIDLIKNIVRVAKLCEE